MKNPFKYHWFWSNPELVFTLVIGIILGLIIGIFIF